MGMAFAIVGIIFLVTHASLVILWVLFSTGAIPETRKEERWFPQPNQRQRYE